MSDRDPLAVNRAHWDALAAVHGQSAYYDIDALVAGTESLDDLEEAAVHEAVGEVADRDVLHVQCHIGFDTVVLARRGARVTGVDFSPVSLSKARDLAARCGVAVEFVEADATALPRDLHGRFDLAYATMGVLSWIGDLEGWMGCVHAALRPGGKLVLVEIHPVFLMVTSREPLVLDFPYADRGPLEFDEPGSYADADADVGATASIEHGHSLGEVLTAAVRAGLRVDALHEHLDIARDPRGDVLAREDDGRFRLRVSGELLPVAYTLIATRT